MQQSLQLQEIKSSLQSLEQSVKILSERSEKRSASDVIDVDSLLSSFSSNPPSESSAFLPPAFGSPSFFPTSTSSSLHPTIPSLSGKQTRASSAQPIYRYFQQDCHGGASCWSGDSYSQSGGVLELEGGVPSTRDETLTSSDDNYPAVSWRATTGSQLFNQGATPQFRDGIPSQNVLGQPVECESPTQGASVIPTRLVNKFTPISPTKYKSSDEVISLYKDYKNTKDIGKLAIALAKYTYFGSSVMAQSTVTGRGGTTPLDPVKLQHLRRNIRAIFPLMDNAEFNQIWDKCKISIAGCCKIL